MTDMLDVCGVTIAAMALILGCYNSYYLWLQNKERVELFPSITFVNTDGVRNIISLKHLTCCPQEEREVYCRQGLLTIQLVNKSCFDVEIFTLGLSKDDDVCRIGIFEPVFVYGSAKTEDMCEDALALPFKMKRGESVVFALRDEEARKAINLGAYNFQIRTSRCTLKKISIERLLMWKFL